MPFAPIDNVDGSQAAFFFATPDVELYQDTATAFEAGKAYRLSMLVEGGGSAYSLMKAGVPIEIRLFFRDRGGNRITVGSAGTVNTNVSGWIGHLNDLVLDLPAVKATDAWAGKNIGVQIVSTVGYDDAGGYWDIDNVRLNSATVGDANFDGLVNDNDLGALLSAWGTGNTWGQGDFNADGAVDDNDLGTLLSAWTGSAAAAPEPLTIGMLMIGGALALRRRN